MDAEVHDVVTVRSGSKPRRPHKKAKTGCLDCRRRRVKVSGLYVAVLMPILELIDVAVHRGEA
jgi:hypothetical protein